MLKRVGHRDDDRRAGHVDGLVALRLHGAGRSWRRRRCRSANRGAAADSAPGPRRRRSRERSERWRRTCRSDPRNSAHSRCVLNPRGDGFQPDDPRQLPDLALLLLAEPHDERHRGGDELLDFGAVDVDLRHAVRCGLRLRACWRTTLRSVTSTAGQNSSWVGVSLRRVRRAEICASSSRSFCGSALSAFQVPRRACGGSMRDSGGSTAVVLAAARPYVAGAASDRTVWSAGAEASTVMASRSPLASRLVACSGRAVGRSAADTADTDDTA